MVKEKKFFTYKGIPMVRRGDTIYYGNLEEKYVIVFTIKSKKKVGSIEVADAVKIELCTNSGAKKEKIIRFANAENLYEAIDIAEFWLQDAIENG